MNDMTYPQTESDLIKMIQLLESDGLQHWAVFFKEALDLLQEGRSEECAKHILSGSGGMGSLNDVSLGQQIDSSGHFIAGKQENLDLNVHLVNCAAGFMNLATILLRPIEEEPEGKAGMGRSEHYYMV